MTATVTAVAVVHQILPNPGEDPDTTAIDKRPVPGAVQVGEMGLTGDTQVDSTYHGGVFQAVYAYADEDAAWWAGELGREIPPGLFGENLRTSGIDVSNAEVGERWQIGSSGPLLEVTAPRTPCATFAKRMQEPRWVKRFTAKAALGAYFRVLRDGPVVTGDAITVVHRPGHGVVVSKVITHADPEAMARLLRYAEGTSLELHRQLRKTARRLTRQAERQATGAG